jgi:hypothetical protein
MVNGQNAVTVKIIEGSTLSIHGKTNINSFVCSQTHDLQQSPQRVIVHQEGTSLTFENAELTIKVDNFDCGHKIMTNDFRKILETDKNPYLFIKLHSILKTTSAKTYTAEVSIKLAGVSRRYRIPVEVVREEDLLVGLGVKEVKFQEFNLEPPVKFMGMVKVKEELKISFNIRLDTL